MNKNEAIKVLERWRKCGGPDNSITVDVCDLAIAALRGEPEQPKLKPCPACGGEAGMSAANAFVRCKGTACDLVGPAPDHRGERWNALPRRGEPEQKRPTLEEQEAVLHSVLDLFDEGWLSRAKVVESINTLKQLRERGENWRRRYREARDTDKDAARIADRLLRDLGCEPTP